MYGRTYSGGVKTEDRCKWAGIDGFYDVDNDASLSVRRDGMNTGTMDFVSLLVKAINCRMSAYGSKPLAAHILIELGHLSERRVQVNVAIPNEFGDAGLSNS